MSQALTVFEVTVRAAALPRFRKFAPSKLVFACTAKERLSLEKSLGELETMLQPVGFLRISRSELVNLEMVRELAPYFSGTWRVKLANGEERDVSRERAKRLKEAMGVE